MKTRTLLSLGLGLAMSCAAWADEALDPAALGSIDAMLATCRQLNPSGAPAYDMLRTAMIGAQSESTLAAVAQTAEYKQAFEAARKQAETEPRDAASKGCAQLAAALGPRAPRGGKNQTQSK